VASRSSSIGGLMMPSGAEMEEDTLYLPMDGKESV
jgi:hypothetical protein